jgi:SagB-type dehydrogenase family enzyme
LETYLVAGDIDDLAEGVYRYQPVGHKLVKILDGDYRVQLTWPAAGPYFVEGGAIYMIFTGVYNRIGVEKWVHMELGHATQNVYLQAVALGLGTVVCGGINSDYIREILELPENEQQLYSMPVGRL